MDSDSYTIKLRQNTALGYSYPSDVWSWGVLVEGRGGVRWRQAGKALPTRREKSRSEAMRCSHSAQRRIWQRSRWLRIAQSGLTVADLAERMQLPSEKSRSGRRGRAKTGGASKSHSSTCGHLGIIQLGAWSKPRHLGVAFPTRSGRTCPAVVVCVINR